jgi:hypothetical protein
VKIRLLILAFGALQCGFGIAEEFSVGYWLFLLGSAVVFFLIDLRLKKGLEEK